jgi:hypothetical protein
MSFFSWLRNRNRLAAVQPSSKHRPGRRPTTFQPHLETLEDRDVPTTLTVTSVLGFGIGTLRTEIGLAQPGDTIVFAQSLFDQGPQTIDLGTDQPGFGEATELLLSKDLAIQGPGAGELEITGGGAERVFDIAQNTVVTISGLTVEGGNARTGAYEPARTDGLGGGILNEGNLTLSGCTVTHNTAINGYSGEGGGIANLGYMKMTDCTVTGNSASYRGGGVYNTGLLIVTDSTVTQNTAGYVKGGGGDDLFNLGTLDVSGSTIGSKKNK